MLGQGRPVANEPIESEAAAPDLGAMTTDLLGRASAAMATLTARMPGRSADAGGRLLQG
jgi:hypothetical protein